MLRAADEIVDRRNPNHSSTAEHYSIHFSHFTLQHQQHFISCSSTQLFISKLHKGTLVKVCVKIVIALLTRLEQQRFTISEVAADCHELMDTVAHYAASIARDGEQLDPRCSTQIYHRPNQRTMPSPRRP